MLVKTIADIIQYKRWVANSIVIEEEDGQMFEEKEIWSDSENDIEYNQELVDWLDDWEKEKVVEERAEEILQPSRLYNLNVS